MSPDFKQVTERFLEMDREFREAIELVRGAEKLTNLAGLVVVVAVTMVCWVPTRGQVFVAIGAGLATWIIGRSLVSRYLGAPLLRMLREKRRVPGRE